MADVGGTLSLTILITCRVASKVQNQSETIGFYKLSSETELKKR